MLQNTVTDNPDYYSSIDQFLVGANNHSTEPTPYLDPAKTTRRLANDDYEAPPGLDNYNLLHNVQLIILCPLVIALEVMLGYCQ